MAQARRVGRPAGPPTKVVRLPVSVATLARVIAARGLRAGDLNGFIDVESRTKARVPLATDKVSAGFPSPADDYLESPLDFNELLIENPAATFAVRVAGDSMIGAGIFPDDIAIVDRARTPKDKNIVLALVDGGFTLKRFRRRQGRIWLQAENPAYADTEITGEMSFEIWGVVTKAIRML
ncbi:MAG: polymerase [Alphaproteobacteria bacterium]|nr:polymerase [Alphaproteobacteria bacterium]